MYFTIQHFQSWWLIPMLMNKIEDGSTRLWNDYEPASNKFTFSTFFFGKRHLKQLSLSWKQESQFYFKNWQNIITRKFLIWQVGSGQIQTPSSLHFTNISLPFTSNSSRSLRKTNLTFKNRKSWFEFHLISFSPSSFFSRLTKAHLELNLSMPDFMWTI